VFSSDEDLVATRSIASAAETVGIPLVDHVIVTRDRGRFHSMRAAGTL